MAAQLDTEDNRMTAGKIKIGSKLLTALPVKQRDGIEDYLWAKSGGKCYLCETAMNQAVDAIEADHDTPESEGGETDRDNLWLAHQACNRAKRANPTVEIRPYLKLRAFLASNHHVVRYDGILAHFGIKPIDSILDQNDQVATFDFSDGTQTANIFRDQAGDGMVFEYCFVEVPRDALFNDDEVQPRTLKIAQVWAIYTDLQFNPLHEPPSCRVIGFKGKHVHLALFDGQHKTVAHWMEGNQSVCVKVYLNMNKDQANYLVNSIQAKIKKLPLSPFELSAKLSDEWTARLEEYRTHVPNSDASEKGFIDWLDSSERGRAKSAFEAALMREIEANPDLRLTQYVIRSGQQKTPNSLISETQFNKKILKKLLHTAPLEEVGTAAEEVRKRESYNIVWALNLLEESFFQPSHGAQTLTDLEEERRRRYLYQGAMQYVSDLLRSLYRQTLATDPPREFLDKYPNKEQEGQIRAGIERIANHPLWTVDLEHSAKTRAIKDALSKNQSVEDAFGNVGLKTGYVVGADNLPNSLFN